MYLSKFLSLVAPLLTLLVLQCTSPSGSSEMERWKERADATTIVRDSYGVAHVYGETDADAVFGVLYAQCEDDFNRVEVNYINALGRMAEVKGETSLYTDLRMRLFIDEAEVKKEFENSPEWLKQLMIACADGYNYYLHKNPEIKPKLITHFEPWMVLAFTEGSIGGDIKQLSTAGIKRFYGKEKDIQLTMNESYEAFYAEPTGSNGFAIAPSKSASGNSLLLINPHTSFFFRGEYHMVSKEGLNAYGAITWGQFFIYQGFNEYNGWMHTSSKADVIDYYAETIKEKNGSYLYKHGEEWKPVIEKNITLKYKDKGQTSTKTIKTYHTHHGPIVRDEDGKWIAIALMSEHEKALTQSYTRTKTKDYASFKKTMDLRTNSSNNTVYADKNGDIAYYHGNFMPIRDQSFDWNGVVDGSNPATDWKGLHAVDEIIHIHNPSNGWIQNCNSTPYTACGDMSPRVEDYAPYMAPDLENPRGIHALMVLKDAKPFTKESLLEAAYDSYLPKFEELFPPLFNAYNRLSPSSPIKKELAAPINTLRNWDLRYSLTSVATSVAVYFGQETREQERKKQKNDPLKALQSAVEILKKDFGTWEVAWGEINRYQRINGDISQPFNDDEPSIAVPFASSRWGSLAAYGSRKFPGTKRMYGTRGNSFVAAVEFGDKVSALSILTGGQSGDPSSPHFSDQAAMYAKGEFKKVRFYKEDVDKDAKSTYHPGGKK